MLVSDCSFCISRYPNWIENQNHWFSGSSSDGVSGKKDNTFWIGACHSSRSLNTLNHVTLVNDPMRWELYYFLYGETETG